MRDRAHRRVSRIQKELSEKRVGLEVVTKSRAPMEVKIVIVADIAKLRLELAQVGRSLTLGAQSSRGQS